jgi:hypothetical protein
VATLIASGWSIEDADEVLIGGLFGVAQSPSPATVSALALLEGLKRTFTFDPPQSVCGPHIASAGAKARELPFACISMIALALGAVSLFLPALARWPL